MYVYIYIDIYIYIHIYSFSLKNLLTSNFLGENLCHSSQNFSADVLHFLSEKWLKMEGNKAASTLIPLYT